MLRRFRLKWAYQFGKTEHKFGKYIGLFTAIAILLNFLRQSYFVDRIFLITIFCIWVTYLISHTLEKKFFGHMGPRG